MPTKDNLGKDRTAAIRLARSLNSKYRIQIEQQSARLEISLDFGSACFETEFDAFVSKYIDEYRA